MTVPADRGRGALGVVRLPATVLLGVAILLLASWATSVPAQAKTLHKYEPPQILEVPAGAGVENPGLFGEANAMMVDSGNLWMAEHADSSPGHTSNECGERACAYRIDEFNGATRAFERQLVMSSAPSTAGSVLRNPDRGIAIGHVDGGAQVYVGAAQEVGASSAAGVVSVFDGQSGDFVETWSGAGTPEAHSFGERGVQDVAVDGGPDLDSGDVFVADDATRGSGPLDERVVDVFKPEAGGGEHYVGQITGPALGEHFDNPLAVTVSGFNGDVLVVDNRDTNAGVGEGTRIDMFRPSGLGEYEFVTQLVLPGGLGAYSLTPSLAVDGGNGEIYVAVQGPKTVYDETVYEYSAAGVLVGSFTGSETPEKSFVPERLSSGVQSVAVNSVSHRVFVGDRAYDNRESGQGLVDVFGPDVVIPDVVSEGVSGVRLEGEEGRWSARVNGKVDPDGAGPATCWFVWGASSSFGAREACVGKGESEEEPLPNGSVAVSVHASLTNLLSGTTYYYRLQARNSNGVNEGEAVEGQSFTTPGPDLLGESVSEVASSSATLHADVNLLGNPASYYFQYSTGSTQECGAGTGGGCSVVPGVALSVGDGSGVMEVPEQHVDGLRPNTTYHYRLVVESEWAAGEHAFFDGPDETFVTRSVQAPLVLPDGRAWELVSPADLRGATIEPIGEQGAIQASSGGETITYGTNIPTESTASGFYEHVQVLSAHGPGGWSSRDISLPHEGPTTAFTGEGYEYRFFSGDLSVGLVQPIGPFTPLTGEVFPAQSERSPLLRHDFSCVSAPGECYEPLLTHAEGYADVPATTSFGALPGESEYSLDHAVAVVGTSPDVNSVVLQAGTGVELASRAGTAEGSLYEWSAGAGASERVRPVSVPPDGTTTAENGFTLGVNAVASVKSQQHAISDNGERVFWTADEEGSYPHLYMRDLAKSETLRIDLTESGTASAHDQALFQAASANGERVFFTDSTPLTSDASASGFDLYECRIVEVEQAAGEMVDKCDLSDLTPEPAGGGGVDPAEVQGEVLGVSEDGGYVYFVANGAYGGAPSRGTCTPEPSAGQICNLYVWHEGDGEPRYIATLSGQDAPAWRASTESNGPVARVSPNGEWLAFMSDRSLTGYDNEDVSSAHPGERMDEEVYLYRVGEGGGPGGLVCASCNPSGQRPEGKEYVTINDKLAGGDRVWEPYVWIAANIPAWTSYKDGAAQYQARYLSNEGRLFFDSSDALVPQDINRQEDVYEYEPVGVGGAAGCTSSSPLYVAGENGCVDLISKGTSAGESAFMDASENGDDVFFLSSEKLTGEASDTIISLYDAHVCGAGWGCSAVSPAPEECRTAEACRGAPAPEPTVFAAPSSATFQGAGNPMPNTTTSTTTTTTKAATRTAAQKLNVALKACRKRFKDAKHSKRRAECEKSARKRFASKTNAKKASRPRQAGKRKSKRSLAGAGRRGR